MPKQEKGPDESGPLVKLVVADQIRRTFSARGPFGPRPSVNDTACPSRRSSNRTPSTFDVWKKMSDPDPVAMKPKPLSVSRLIVPSDIPASCVLSRAQERGDLLQG